jgi:hypothetical protein
MWVRQAAIRPVPPYAKVSAAAIERVELRLTRSDRAGDQTLLVAFSSFERTQPALSARMAASLKKPRGETVLALGYFLCLAVWMSFEETFGPRLRAVTEDEVSSTLESLTLDGEIRQSAPDEVVETDDVIAMEQPDLVEFIREHIDVALEADPTGVEVDEVDEIYQIILLEVIALSYAITPPDNAPANQTEWSA